MARQLWTETGFFVFCLALLLFLLRVPLFQHTTTLAHDNLFWLYPAFHFAAENLVQGRLPLWDPFSHAGEPFHLTLTGLRFLDPLLPLVVGVGQVFSRNTVALFNWHRVIVSLVCLSGVYLVLRPVARNLPTRLALMTVLFFSSTFLGSFRQAGILDQFLWTPYFTFACLQILYYGKGEWPWFLLAGALFGMHWQAHFFTGLAVFVLFWLVGTLLYRRDLLTGLGRIPNLRWKVAAGGALTLAMMGPNLVFLAERDDYVFPVRFARPAGTGTGAAMGPVQFEGGPSYLTEEIRPSYASLSQTGSFATLWNFVHLISPFGNSAIQGNVGPAWGNPSEAYLYVGLVPLALALWGLFAGSHSLKKVWALVLGGFGLLLLGPAGGLHRLLFLLFPPSRFTRNTHTYVLFFEFALLYFFVLGANDLFRRMTPDYAGHDQSNSF